MYESFKPTYLKQFHPGPQFNLRHTEWLFFLSSQNLYRNWSLRIKVQINIPLVGAQSLYTVTF